MRCLAYSFCAFFLVLSPLHSAEAKAQLKGLELEMPMRSDIIQDHERGGLQKGRFQYQTSLRFDVELMQERILGQFNVLGLLGSGGSYTSQWNTIWRFDKPQEQSHPITMRQLYVRHGINGWRSELGVVPPVKGIVSNTSLDKDGWIRGARLVAPIVQTGELEAVIGSLHGIDSPGLMSRWQPINYIEFEWTQPWYEFYRSELGATVLNGQHHLRVEASTRINATPFPLTSGVELMRNVSAKQWAYDWYLDARFKTLHTKLEYSFVAHQFGRLGALSNDFFTLGHLGMIALKGPVGKSRTVTWFFKQYVGESELRANAGIKIRVAF